MTPFSEGVSISVILKINWGMRGENTSKLGFLLKTLAFWGGGGDPKYDIYTNLLSSTTASSHVQGSVAFKHNNLMAEGL